MDSAKIAELLQNSVNTVLEKIGSPAKPESNADVASVVSAVSSLSKAVQGIAEKVENLDKTAVKNTPETVESQIAKVATVVESLAKKVEAISKGENLEDDANIDFSKMSKKEFATLIKGIADSEESSSSPKGEGKDELKNLLKSLAKGEESEVNIDEIDVEDTDVAGNELSKKQKVSRSNLDKHLGKMLKNMVASHGIDSADADDDEDDE